MVPNTKKSFLSLVRGTWEATIDERGRFFLFVGLFIVAYSLDLLVPWAVGYTLGVLAKEGLTDAAFYQASLGLLAYTLLRLTYTALHHIARYVQNRVAYSARMHTLTKLFDAYMKFPLRWHIQNHSGESLSKLHRSAGAVESMVGTYIWQVIEGSVKVIFAGVAILTLDYWVAINVLGLSVVTIALMILINKKLTEKIRRNNIFGNKINRICVDYLINVVTVKTLGVEDSAKRSLRTQRPEGLILTQKVSKYMEMMWGATGLGYVLVISSSLLIYFMNHQSLSEPFDIAKVYVLLNYLDRIFQAIGSFTGYYSGVIQAATAYEDASEVLDQAATIPDSLSPSQLSPNWETMQLKNVNFSYVPGEKVGLTNVDITIKRGEKIALVGHSGSGKSTLLKVLAGLIPPESYFIQTDTQASLSIEDVVSASLLIPQEPEIFSDTVIYNLTMGEEFDPKEISFFVSLCKLDILLGKLPQGWDTSLVEKGLNLSVGEKQRLALARGLLRVSGKEMLLLDEPTSSLDPKTEKEIYLGLLYHFTNRTVFSSCHRLNLIPLFDKIIFMAQGQVLEVGTFSELLEKRGHFFRAWEDYEKNIRNTPGASESAAS